MTRVLVGYATVHGSTRWIAERIGARLADAGVEVDVVALAEQPDPRTYDACILGSAIHEQAWLREAIGFVRVHAASLRARPVWLYSVGVPAALAPRWRKRAGREGGKVMEPPRHWLRVHGEHLFSGVLYPEHLPRIGRLLFRALGGRFGDFRDADEIDAWTAEIIRRLPAATTHDRQTGE